MSIILNKLVRQFFDALLEDIDNNNYYIFYSHPNPWAVDFSPPPVTSSMQDAEFDTNFYSVCGKKITSDDIRFMATRTEWSMDTTYDHYAHDDDLSDKDFFVITDENNVYKCLYNNKNNPSTVKPSLVQNTVFKTSDGYYWKYMYSLTSGELNRFGMSNFIPIVANNDVTQSATTGIDLVDIMNPGIGYITYNTGSVQAVSNTTYVQIDSSAIRENGYYNRSAFYVSEGPGIGGYAIINGYTSNEQGSWALLDRPVTGMVPSLSKYVISPAVIIEGDGTGARAVSYINMDDGSLDRINIVVPGNNYTNARARLDANTSYGTGALIKVYPSPPNGHGSEPVSELNSDRIMISKTISGSESNTIPSFFDFRRVGLIKNPVAANGEIWTADTFDNTWLITVQNPSVISVGDSVFGETTKSNGYVFYKDANNNIAIVGDNGFQVGDAIIKSNDSGVRTQITNIVHTPDLMNLGTILDINNNIPISKENTSEIAKITLKIH